VRLELA